MIHELKCWPSYFAAVLDGRKPFEVRERRDRDFKVGDELWLREWDQMSFQYSGRDCRRTVTYVLDAAPFVPPGYCVMGLSVALSETKQCEVSKAYQVADMEGSPLYVPVCGDHAQTWFTERNHLNGVMESECIVCAHTFQSANTPSYADIAGAVARGWCSPNNEHKVMDPDLAFAITVQVAALIDVPDRHLDKNVPSTKAKNG